ncbi:hypothetical protein [Pseudodesulfovibrio tunisiensis]|uniref:hypothetical protein n=1 Tax=Pseudodesulfovibrio tunisiensis TaxID=463192 RepID=UPI001FB4F98A|nr:hypothetical protein [Pseudodesulfovibrio tunisiensis]
MRSLFKSLFPLAMVVIMAACTTTGTSSAGTETAPPPDGSMQQAYEEPNYYYDFDDILIPKELGKVDEDSYKLDNPKFRAAIMKFKGRVHAAELSQFFLNNMAKDNWQLKSNVSAGKLAVLSFEKFNKSAVVQIQDGFGNVETTIIAVETKDAHSLK